MNSIVKTKKWCSIPTSITGLALLAGSAFSQNVIDRTDADSLTALTMDSRRTGIVVASEMVVPSVVSITVLQTRTYTSPFMIDPFFEEFFGHLFPHEYSRDIQSLGSGIIVSPDGEIITNAHVLEDATNIKATLSDGRTFDARILGIDEGLDLALLALQDPPPNLQPAVLGNSEDLMIGEWAIALGNPLGFLIADANPSVTAGVISAVGRRVQTSEGRRFSYSGVIQTDAAINPGNSGGPLANILGEVIGINTFIFTQSGGSEGLGFAIPINQVKKFMYELEHHQTRRIAWLGIGVQTLTADMARALSIPGTKGIIINRVFDATPAARAGLEEAWVITSANGINFPSESDWQMMEQGLFVGDSVVLTGITDAGRPFSRTVKAAEYTPPSPVRISELNIEVSELDPAMRFRYDITSMEGVIIMELDQDGVGAELGLKQGDVILSYDSKVIVSVSDLKQAIKTEKNPRTLVIERDGGRYRLYRGF